MIFGWSESGQTAPVVVVYGIDYVELAGARLEFNPISQHQQKVNQVGEILI
jgi:hypothetical protein